MIDEDLIRLGCMSADSVAIGFEGTGAERTRAILQRALEALEANGVIVVAPKEEWQDWYVPDPPYQKFI